MKIIVSTIGIGVAIVLFAAFVYTEVAIRQGEDVRGEVQDIVIEEGLGLRDVAILLENRGLIRGDTLFVYYVWRAGNADRLQAGTYVISPAMSIKEIADIVTAGKVRDSGVRVTIPEGFKREAIANRLVKEGVLKSAEDFLTESVSLEGYMYPDTYTFEKNISAEHVVDIMFANFEKKALPIINEENTVQFSLENAIILASLIEKEVQTTSDMHGISGVLHNRLTLGIPLQVDATLMFITGKTGPELVTADKAINSPYNTYRYAGLPSGPIANPGLRAIRAALNPEEHDFLYYLSTPEGETIFSKTLEEHNINRTRFLR